MVDSSRKKWFILSLVASFVLYLPQIFWSFGHDQNVFAAIGSMMLKGFSPYTELWDVKPPNIFYTYSLAQLLFGRSEVSIRIFDLISTLMSAALIFKLVENTLSGIKDYRWITWSAATGAILYIATNLSLGLADTAQTESFSQPFLLGAFVLWSKERRSQRSLFFVGIFISLAVLFKLTNLLFFPALVLLELIFKRGKGYAWLKCIAVLGFGLLLGVVIQLAALLVQGSLWDFFRMMSNVIRYHTEPGSLRILDIVRTLWVYADLALLFSIAGLAYYYFGRHEKIGLLKRLSPLIVLLFIGAIIVLSQGKGWGYHYVVLLPTLIPIIAIGYGFVLSQASNLPTRSVSIIAIVCLIVAPLLLGPSGRRRIRHTESSWTAITNPTAYLATLGTPRGIYEPSCTEVLAKRIEDETYERDRIFILGHEPGTYWKSDRRPASRFVYTLLLSSPVVRDLDIDSLINEVTSHRPKVLVVQMFDTVRFSGKALTSQDLLASDQFIPMRTLLRDHYDLRDTVCGKFLLYRRRAWSPET